ncbi:uncharacterized protein FIBRA_07876 [Fibroporia radiculosa]|uniref:Uncharacterized protein n=1 Tax=Fibroporia radiculosa TaxID=599839 RepID=J4IC20_9APHY|nr:uncharacterized protein FIBRA_07876 [Fibroporia radiculosa]CCM05646.1 predicted protein [Fibroporia radiculosa]
MPRLFPNLGRSSKENARGEYAYYEDCDPQHGQYGYGYDEQAYEAMPRAPSAWRRVLSRKSKTGGRAYYGEGEIPGFQRSRSYRATVEDYPESRPGMHYAASDDTESYVNIPSRAHSPVPIVQRESSLSRLQEAFADHGTYSPATLESSTPQPHRATPRQMPQARPVQLSTIHEARHEPRLVSSSTTPLEGIRPDVMRTSTRRRPSRHVRPTFMEPEEVEVQYVESEAPAVQWGHQTAHPEEYPSVVVVVQRGRHGEKDTYYIIPGGAPVIFEDDNGNEITRVGDFSGNYIPQPTRPVIVQDEYGRELCRAGFDDNGVFGGSHSSNYYGGQRSRHRSRPRRDDRYDSERGGSYRSHRYQNYGYDNYDEREYGRRDYHDPYEDDGSPQVVFVDPSNSSSSGSHRSTSRHGVTNYRHEDVGPRIAFKDRYHGLETVMSDILNSPIGSRRMNPDPRISLTSTITVTDRDSVPAEPART